MILTKIMKLVIFLAAEDIKLGTDADDDLKQRIAMMMV